MMMGNRGGDYAARVKSFIWCFFFCRDEFLIKMNKIFYNLLF
jgi:hypothetical protein